MTDKKLLGLALGIIAIGTLIIILSVYGGATDSSSEDGITAPSSRGARISWMNETINQTWQNSSHAKTFYHDGETNNTYCAKCMSPYNYDPAANYTNNDPVDEANWAAINCTVCHDPANYLNLSFYNGTGREEPVNKSVDLCIKCHSGSRHETGWDQSAHANTYHNGTGHDNDNSYCARCVSPFQYDPDTNRTTAYLIPEDEWEAITCIVCHDQHSLELALFNGTGREEPVEKSADLCTACHSGSHHETGWGESAHANTYHNGTGHDNDNSYCARCVSPFQYDPDTNRTTAYLIPEDEWEAITCIVCHDPHTLELALFNGTGREEPVNKTVDLCTACHSGSHHDTGWGESAHANTYHSGTGHDNDNSYCARCVSPFQYDPDTNRTTAYQIPEDEWEAITCIVCHDPHTLELALFNGTGREEPVEKSADLCTACHSGSHHDTGWGESAHANTYHPGENNNSYCARCVSPFQYDPDTNRTTAYQIPEDEWEAITCIVCHDQHTLELALFNGTGREEPIEKSVDLCTACHSGSHHDTGWGESAHANTYHPGENDNSYCARCVSPFQYDPDVNRTTADTVPEDEWEAITCIVCHDPHTLEIALFNGTGREEHLEDPTDLCTSCHSGSHHDTGWGESAHAKTYHPGSNDNSYCARCVSPLNYDPSVNRTTADTIPEDDWTAIGCIICHDPHTLELALFNGTEREEHVEKSADLCTACHSGSHHGTGWEESAHAKTYHNGTGHDNDNSYCARCVSPFQYDPDTNRTTAYLIPKDEWEAITCIVCHDQHTLELALFNGTGREEPIDKSVDLCTACHSGSHHGTGWEESAHANTYHNGTGHDNDNSYCARCVSPFQYDPDTNRTTAYLIPEDEWEAITCIVCHDEHSLELALYNGTGREEPVENPADLCTACHSGSHHGTGWEESPHATTGVMDKDNSNTFCARCHSPFQGDPEATVTNNTAIPTGTGTGVTCTVCHNPHTLELAFYDGAEHEEIEDPNELCGKCHSGTDEFPGAPFVPDTYGQWEESAHANTWKGSNGNTYCAHCMSPYQAGDEASQASRLPVTEENWTNIGCLVCHDQHSSELILYNGSAKVPITYDEKEEKYDTNELCGSCHTMADAELGDTPHHATIEMRTGTGGIGVEDTPYHSDPYCYDCHGYESDHSFHFNLAACGECHSKYENETMAQDQVDEWQEEIGDLMNWTYQNLTKAEGIMISAIENNTWTNESLNDSYYTARFNYYIVESDGSTGAHNVEYARKLLQLANAKANEVIDSEMPLPTFTVSPLDGTQNVPIDTKITVTFTKNINFIQNTTYITVSNGVTGTLTYDNITYKLTFTPSAPLAYNTTYTVTLSKNIKYADNSMVTKEDYVWSFKTKTQVLDIKVKIGQFVDKDGDPIEGAKVTITLNGKTYTGTTDSNGFVEFTIPAADFAPGTVNVKATKKGYKDLEFTGTVDANGLFTPPAGGIPQMQKKETKPAEDNTMLILILVVIIVIIIIALLALAMRKKEEPEEEAAEEGEEEEGEEEKEEMECPECGATVTGGETECPECGAEFEEAEEEAEEGEEEAEEMECPECGATVATGETTCPECGAEFEVAEEEEELEGEEEELEEEEVEGEEEELEEEELEGEEELEDEEFEEGEEEELEEEEEEKE